MDSLMDDFNIAIKELVVRSTWWKNDNSMTYQALLDFLDITLRDVLLTLEDNQIITIGRNNLDKHHWEIHLNDNLCSLSDIENVVKVNFKQ